MGFFNRRQNGDIHWDGDTTGIHCIRVPLLQEFMPFRTQWSSFGCIQMMPTNATKLHRHFTWRGQQQTIKYPNQQSVDITGFFSMVQVCDKINT
jgi:hypothetical protein